MHLRNCLLLTLAFSLLRPLAAYTQERFEINVGISTPGLDEVQDTKLFFLGVESFDTYSDKPLSNLEKSFKTTVFPSYSLEFSYDLAESGFFKRLDLVGYASYHSAIMEVFDIINNTSRKETARKVDLLIGLRYDVFKKEKLNMYAQLLIGDDIMNSSSYWDYLYPTKDDKTQHTALQLALGFNKKLGGEDSKWGWMTELGYGSEFATSVNPLFPGIRMGLSYKF